MNPVREHDIDGDIDALLRQSFDGPVSGAGFSDRVMQHVSPVRRAPDGPLRHWIGSPSQHSAVRESRVLYTLARAFSAPVRAASHAA